MLTAIHRIDATWVTDNNGDNNDDDDDDSLEANTDNDADIQEEEE